MMDGSEALRSLQASSRSQIGTDSHWIEAKTYRSDSVRFRIRCSQLGSGRGIAPIHRRTVIPRTHNGVSDDRNESNC